MNLKGGDSGSKIAVVIILVTLVLVFLWYNSYYSKKNAAIVELQQEYERLDNEYQKAKMLATNLEQLQHDYEKVKAKWLQIREKVPMTKDLAGFMDDMKAAAYECGVQVKKVRSQTKMIYAEWERHQFQFELIGSYHQIGEFISKISKTQRIITVEYVELMGLGNLYEDPSKVNAVIVVAISQFTKEPEGLDSKSVEESEVIAPAEEITPEQGDNL